MKLLIITHDYPPLATPRALRWGSVVKQLQDMGHHVTVISAGEQRRPWQALYRTQTKSPRVVRLLKSFYNLTWRQLYWPDATCLWYFTALAKAKRQLQQTHYDALITVSHPVTAHLVGLALKKRHPSLYWLADIGDPFSFMPEPQVNNFKLYRKRNQAFERKLLSLADGITVTNNRCLQKYGEHFPFARHKMHRIPACLPTPNNTPPQNCIVLDNRMTHLVFAGTLYRGIRNPSFVINLFKRLQTEFKNLCLHFMGKVHDCGDYFNTAIPGLYHHGEIPQAQVFHVLKQADLLVNIGNRNTYQTPSKLLEYMQTGKPILNCLPSTDCDQTETIHAYPSLLTLTGCQQAPNRAQLQQVSAFLRNLPSALAPERVEHLLIPHQPQHIAKSYLALLPPDFEEVAAWEN